ncbi:FxsB family cyclophane-forming radical SAM/SPASM peptide maturase [Streptacidiphilus sp. EB129]|uniref:FxsB family cyclophane-forming radical SAM/SPASM peptide maturase n=1 Tax=Streptacidiphilus sp. EB129 TaxID=3156262 RepID=UPI003513C65D
MDKPRVPFRQFVVKLHSRCDLACDHCYVYEHADTSWRGKPRAASETVLRRTAERIAEHAKAHRLNAVHVVLHGGEPLLVGPVGIRRAAEILTRELSDVCALDLRIHTNGVLLSERFLDVFDAFDIKVGISLDGDRVANDRHRRYADGRSSHHQVLAAIALLDRPEYRHLYAGLLCTIDVLNDPVAVYDALLELNPPRIDFLLPHATWDQPPPRPDGRPSPYADWLLTIYDRWQRQGRPVPVRMFDSVRRTLDGLSSLTESLGLDPADLVVVETDGTLEQADSLKTAFDGAPVTGFDVFKDSLDAAAGHPGMLDRQLGLAALSGQCQACPVVRSCGGGLYAHRYRTGAGFNNPSVFCPDLMALITGVEARVAAETRQAGGGGGAGADLLTDEQLGELAAGYGGAGTVRAMARAQLELNRRLLAQVWQQAAGDRTVTAAWELLTGLDETAPAAVDQVLAHPYTRAWAVRCLSGGSADSGGIAEVAAAAAVRAARADGDRTSGAAAGVVVPVREGVLRLPGLGRVLLPGCREALVAPTADGFAVTADGATLRFDRHPGPDQDPRWQPLRRIEAPSGPFGPWSVLLEDTDPQRDAHQWPVAARLDPSEAGAWERGLAGAWEFVGTALPGYAEGLAAGLGMITPLRPAPGGRDISAAGRNAFGTVGIARPATAESLALLAVHEFQHVKLGAVLDFHDLFDPLDQRLFYAPWRPDPRPLEGLLQGTYAHLAVSEFWRARTRDQGLDEESARRAQLEFARWRGHTAEAVETLAESGSLTTLGERFAHAMRATVAPWLDEPVENWAVVAAQRSSEETRAQFLRTRQSGSMAGLGG